MTDNPIASAQAIKTAYQTVTTDLATADQVHVAAYAQAKKNFPAQLETAIRTAETNKLEGFLSDELA